MWSHYIRYDWWLAAIQNYQADVLEWGYRRAVQLQDQNMEDQIDMISTYCAGGEL